MLGGVRLLFVAVLYSTAMTESTTSPSGFDLTPLSPVDRDRLAEALTPEERHVMIDHGTERPFCGGFLDEKAQGTYVCRLCGLPLFKSAAKFESGTGWPSFYEEFDSAHVKRIEDRSHGMVRVEIRCARCDGHLGHVFPDGPKPTGERHCLNGAALSLVPEGEPLELRR